MADDSLSLLFNDPQCPEHARNYRHGHKPKDGISKEYSSYLNIRARCTNPNNNRYHRYGGRGIKVCDRWMESFLNFLEDMGRCPGDEYSIDRIDPDGDYSKENCRWATRKEQANKRRTSRYLTYKGETLTSAQWCDRIGISQSALHSRLKAGWPIERALEEPLKINGKRRAVM